MLRPTIGVFCPTSSPMKSCSADKKKTQYPWPPRSRGYIGDGLGRFVKCLSNVTQSVIEENTAFDTGKLRHGRSQARSEKGGGSSVGPAPPPRKENYASQVKFLNGLELDNSCSTC